MAVEIIGKMKPKNNGSFPLIDAIDVEMPDGKRLSEVGVGSGDSIVPIFDLASLGLPSVSIEGDSASFEADTDESMTALKEIMTALKNGAVRFSLSLDLGGAALTVQVLTTTIGQSASAYFNCGCVVMDELFFSDAPRLLTILIGESVVTARVFKLQEMLPAAPLVTAINLGAMETEGKITETYSDGTIKTTTMEFDENGNPIKITDGDGNVITLTW